MGEYSYKNLLDYVLELEENPEYIGKIEEQFRVLMSDYFFKDEAREKPIALFLKTIEIPSAIMTCSSLLKVSPEQIKALTENDLPGNTIAGQIMMSKQYLKVFYSNHQPEYKKLPPSVQLELLDEIKEKNDAISYAFIKMNDDIEADKKRKIITLAALIISNIHKKTGVPYNKLPEPANSILNASISNGSNVFTGKPQDLTDIADDSKIKSLIKTFFVIKQHKDLVTYSDFFKSELKRYQRRVKVR